MATKIIDTTYRFCGKWQDTHEAHLFFGGYLCPGTEGSAAGTVSELVTALEALETVARSHCRAGEPGYDREDVLAYCDEARALLARLKGSGPAR